MPVASMRLRVDRVPWPSPSRPGHPRLQLARRGWLFPQERGRLGVTAATRWRAVPGVTHGRQPDEGRRRQRRSRLGSPCGCLRLRLRVDVTGRGPGSPKLLLTKRSQTPTSPNAQSRRSGAWPTCLAWLPAACTSGCSVRGAPGPPGAGLNRCRWVRGFGKMPGRSTIGCWQRHGPAQWSLR
jgi:hypothetical protein